MKSGEACDHHSLGLPRLGCWKRLGDWLLAILGFSAKMLKVWVPGLGIAVVAASVCPFVLNTSSLDKQNLGARRDST